MTKNKTKKKPTLQQRAQVAAGKFFAMLVTVDEAEREDMLRELSEEFLTEAEVFRLALRWHDAYQQLAGQVMAFSEECREKIRINVI